MPYPKKTFEALEHYKHHLNGIHEDLSAGQAPGIILISCSDSRVMGDKILNPEPGNIFTHQNIGALVQPKEGPDPSLDAFLNYPLLHLEGVHTIVILGHTGCGGIKALTQSILSDEAREHDNISGWVVPLSDQKIASAVKHAREQGMAEADIIATMEQIMPLQSVQRLLERKLVHDGHEISVGDILKEKNIQVIPALYDLTSNHLFVYDFDNKCYQEPHHLPKPKQLTFAKGSTSAAGAMLLVSSLDKGIHGLLNDLNTGKQAPTL